MSYTNSKDAINKHVDKEDKDVFLRSQNATLDIPNRGLTIINESGLYSLIFSSKLPAAKAFKRWVISEVLTSIRTHGAYITEEILEQMLLDSEFLSKLLGRLSSEKQKNAALMDYVDEIRPKARYCDLILQSANVVQISIIAKDYGMTAVAFNRLLHDLGIQYKTGNTWLLYHRHANKGYTKSRTYYTPGGSSVVHTYWTQKGRLFLYETLFEAGIVPLMEIENPAI